MTGADALTELERHMRWRGFARVLGAVAIFAALLVLAGWAFDIQLLKSVLPGAATMKANTALGFLLSGLGLWLLATPSAAASTARTRTRLAASCAGLVALLGTATLAQYLFGVDFGIDTLLVADANPRMAPVTAFAFILLGLALLLRDAPRRGAQLLAEVCALTVALIGLLALLGYAYGVESLYRLYNYTSMAVHTALLFVLLSLGLLAARAERGGAATVASAHGGGLMARRILPFAIALPFLFGWLRLQGERFGLYGTEFGLALFATSNVVIFVTLVWWSARAVNRVDMQRYGTATALQESSRLNEQIIRSVGEGIIVLDRELRYVVWNPFMERLTGIAAQDILGKHPLEGFSHFSAADTYARIERALAGEHVKTADVSFIMPETGRQHWLDDEHTPLHGVNGEIIGVIVTMRDITGRHHAAAALHEANESLERKIAERTAELQATQAQLQLLADHDVLTQIHNRRAFEAEAKARLNEAERYGVHGAVLLLDLDHFKSINDRLGHAAGDAALVAFAGILRRTVRQTDLLARLGGDEFAVLAPHAQSGQAEAFAAKLLQRLVAHPLHHNGESIRLNASIGIAFYDQHTTALAALLAAADQALYQAKQAGRGCYRVHAHAAAPQRDQSGELACEKK